MDNSKFIKYMEDKDYEKSDVDDIIDFITRNYPEMEDDERVMWMAIGVYRMGFEAALGNC